MLRARGASWWRSKTCPHRISWACPSCGEAGLLYGWQGSVYDLSGAPRAEEAGSVRSVVVPEKAYQLLLDELFTEQQVERLLYAARPHPGGGVELSGHEEGFEELMGIIAFESNHAATKKGQRRWDEAYACLQPPRRSWLDQSADVVLGELSDLGLVASQAKVAEALSQQLDVMATALGISRESARRYVGRESLQELARSAALELATEQPGADLHGLPRTIPLSLPTFGRMVAALAETAKVRVANADDVGTGGALDLISLLGQVLVERTEPFSAPVLLPQAALSRAARLMEATAEMLAQGAAAPGLPAATVLTLTAALARDGAALRALLREHGSPLGPFPGS